MGGFQKEHGILYALRQAHPLLLQLTRRLDFSLRSIKYRQSPQHREKLRSLSYLPAQFQRSGIGFSHFRGGITLGGDQRSAQGKL